MAASHLEETIFKVVWSLLVTAPGDPLRPDSAAIIGTGGPV